MKIYKFIVMQEFLLFKTGYKSDSKTLTQISIHPILHDSTTWETKRKIGD